MGEPFLRSKDKGRTGEEYIIKHLDELISDEIIRVIDTSAEKISGKDCVATTADNHEINIEVKTVWNYLTRTNDQEEPSGTLCFELWKDNNRNSPGWLIEMAHPDKYRKAVCPDRFVFLLVAYENVFASIAFEKTSELIASLEDLAKGYGFDLGRIPCGTEALSWQPAANIVGNMWHLPFALLQDMATVTIIGNKPRMRPDIISGVCGTRTCSTETQIRRYERLLQLSSNTIDEDEEFSKAFIGDEADRYFSIIDDDLNTLDSTDFEKYYSYLAKYNSRKGKILDCLRYLLLNMLSHENPSREEGGFCFFPISYDIMTRWSENQGMKLALLTWQRSIKYCAMFGLIRYFRPWKTSENPIDLMVNVNNDSPNNVGYYSPILLTREVLLQADCYAQNYFLDRVKTSQLSKDAFLRREDFKKVNDNYGRDGRIIAKAKEYVHELFMQTIVDFVYDKNYALPSEICRQVKTTMKREKRLWHIPEDRLTTGDGEKEAARQKPYWTEYHRLSKDMSGLAEELEFVCYKQLSKEDKAWLEGTEEIRTGTYIIRSKNILDWYFNRVNQYRQEEREKKNERRRTQYQKNKHHFSNQ